MDELTQSPPPTEPAMQIGGPAPLFEPGLDQAAASMHAPDNSEIPFRTTFTEGVAATWNQGVAMRTSSALMRFKNIWDANSEGGSKITPEQLNEMYKGQTAKPFDEPMTQTAAQLIVDRQAEERALSALTEAGPGGFVYGAANLGAGIVSSSLDPIDFASGLVIGGIFKAAIKGSQLAKGTGVVAKIAQNKALSKGEAFLVNSVEGAVGNLAVEPAQMVAQHAEGQDYDLAQGFVNSIGGAIGFSGARYLGGAVLEKAGRSLDHLLGRKDSLHERVQQTGLAQTLKDEKIRTDTYFRDAAKAVDHNPEIHGEFRHEPELSKAIEKPMFMAADKATMHFEGAKSQQLTDGWGEGVYLGPEHVANGTAASKYADMPASIAQVEGLQNMKLLDIDAPVQADMKASLEAALKRPLEPSESIASVMRELDGIHDSAKDVVKAAAREAGYKGIGFTSEHLGNEKIAAHKQVFVFDEARSELSAKEMRPSDPSKVQRVSKEEIAKNLEQANSPENKLDYDKTIHDEVERYSQEQLPTTNEREAQAMLDEHMEELKAMDEQGTLEPEQKAVLEAIKEERIKDKDTEAVIQMARICKMGK